VRFHSDVTKVPLFLAAGASGVAVRHCGVVCLAVACLAGPATAHASLDPSFAGDGTQTTDFGGRRDAAEAVALQPDGKIVAAGRSSGGDFALARHNRDGSLDPSFSEDGRQTTDFGGKRDGALAIALQPDGRIVAVGRSSAGDFALACYKSDGSLDASFSEDGRQTTDFGSTLDEAAAVALQPDGKIVAAGAAGPPGARGFALARYQPDGSLDSSFGEAGRQTSRYTSTSSISSIAVQADGRIAAAGQAVGMGTSSFVVLRYTANGRPDRAFGSDGIVDTSFLNSRFEPFGDFAGDVVLQPGGRIVASGAATTRFSSGRTHFALARYRKGGSVDPIFAGDGRQSTTFDGNSAILDSAVAADGGIVAAGRSDGGDFTLARYGREGSLAGREVTDFRGKGAANAVAVQPDGRIVAAGRAGGDFGLARYQTLSLRRLRASLRVRRHGQLARLLRRGLAFRVAASGAVRISATLTIPGRRGSVAIGRAEKRLAGGRAARIELEIDDRPKRRLRGATALRARLRVRASDVHGNTTTLSRRLRFG
jgi:uncharacterized delta-60 repeat protein